MRENRRLLAIEKRIEKLRLPEVMAVDFARYRDDPVRFRAEVLGFASATRRSDGTAYQDAVLASVAAVPRVAVRSGHGTGKTRTLAALAAWWLVTRPFSRVVIVAPQFDRQVRGVIFSELSKLVRRARVSLPITLQAGKATMHGHGLEWGIVGLPATEPDRIEGQHAEGGLLLLLDETKGVPQDSFDALMGALSGGEDSRLVIASTPGGATGPFYRACTDPRGLWTVHHLSSEDSSLVSAQWCADRAAEWGQDSALYTTRVRGEFADQGEGQLFGLGLIESAIQSPAALAGPVVLGVDVARSVSGDQNCIAVVRGGHVAHLILWRSPDLMATVARVAHEAALHHPKVIVVDVGGVGGGVVDRLKQLKFPVDAVNFGGAAQDPARFRNRRGEMYFRLRESLEAGKASLLDDDDLVADLSALRYTFDQSGRIVLEGKDEARKRLGRSPDRADAVALAIAGALGASKRGAPCLAITGPMVRPFDDGSESTYVDLFAGTVTSQLAGPW